MSSMAPIGVFDSGIGGTTVVKELMKSLPNEKIVYFGDTARVPYGNKSKETIIMYSRQIADFLISQGVKAIVIACNTAHYFLDEFKDKVNVPIINMVDEAVKHCVELGYSEVGLLCTIGTRNTGLY